MKTELGASREASQKGLDPKVDHVGFSMSNERSISLMGDPEVDGKVQEPIEEAVKQAEGRSADRKCRGELENVDEPLEHRI